MKHLFIVLILIISPLAFCQWEIITPTYEGFNDSYKEIYFLNKDTGFVISGIFEEGESVILRTLDGADTWDTTYKSDIEMVPTTGFLAIDFVNDTVGYIACSGDVLKTENCGETWFSLDTADIWDGAIRWYNMQFINADTGYIAYQDGGSQCLRTFDGGWTWEPDPVMPGFRDFDMSNGVVTGCWGGWSKLDLTTLVWDYGYGVIDDEGIIGINLSHITSNNGQLILTGNKSGLGGGMYSVSEDGGETWKLYDYYEIFHIAEVQFVSNELGFAAGGFIGAMRTWDGGETWFIMETDNHGSEMSQRFQEFHMIDENIGYAVSTDGIYKTTNGGGEITRALNKNELTGIEEGQELTVFSIFPNPVGDFITIQPLSLNGNQIEIFDMAGQLVFSETIQSTQIDVSKLTAGQYTVRLYSENGNYSARIIKE